MNYNYISLLGARPKNEDEIEVIMNSLGQNKNFKPLNFFSIFDGHGGDKISKYLKDKLPSYFMSNSVDLDPSKHSVYNKYINKTYKHVQEKLESFNIPAKTCGSTALVIINYPKSDIYSQLKVINLGDCRAVLCNKDNIAIPLTKDHKPTSWEENTRITLAGGTIIQDSDDDPRINGLSVSRSFGDLDAKPHVSHLPDIYDYEISLGKDKFIIMGCDGVWDVLSNQDAVDFVLFAMDKIKVEPACKTRTKSNIANLLGEYAISKGSQDNISVLIIWF
jgi:serine/threonine protein phosphatase PrpC